MSILHVYSTRFGEDWEGFLPQSLIRCAPLREAPSPDLIYEAVLADNAADFIGIQTSNWVLDFSSVYLEQGKCDRFVRREVGLDRSFFDTHGYSSDCGSVMDLLGADIVVPARYDSERVDIKPFGGICLYTNSRLAARVLDALGAIVSKECPEYLGDLRSSCLNPPFSAEGVFAMRASLLKEYVRWALPLANKVNSSLCNERYASESRSLNEASVFDIAMQYLLLTFLFRLADSDQETVVAYANSIFCSHFECPYVAPLDAGAIHVVIPADLAYAPCASVSIASILQNSSRERMFEFLIFDAGLTEADCIRLDRQVDAADNASLRFVRMCSGRAEGAKVTCAKMGLAAYSRVMMLEYLCGFGKVIFLNPGFVCIGDISCLSDMDLAGTDIAAVIDSTSLSFGGSRDVTSLDIFVADLSCGLGENCLTDEARSAISDAPGEIDIDIYRLLCRNGISSLDSGWSISPSIYPYSKENSKAVFFSKEDLPFLNNQKNGSEFLFWHYAKMTPYYEMLVGLMSVGSSDSKTDVSSHYSTAMGPLVSVVVPVYNSAEFISDALDSLLGQTYGNFEIICVNDGSKDDSINVLREYERYDSRVVVVDKENSGAGATRNVGMSYVRGKYMCFVDSDDFLEPDAFELLVNAAEENSADSVVYCIDRYDNLSGEFSQDKGAVVKGKIPVGRSFYAAGVDNFYKYLVGFTVNKLYRSSFLLGLKLRFPIIAAHEDMPFTYLAMSASKRTFFLDRVLYHYRRSRKGSLSDTTSSKYIYMFEALDCLKKGLYDMGLWEDYRQIFINYALHMCIWKSGELRRFKAIEFRDACQSKWFDYFEISSNEKDFFYEEDDWNFYSKVSKKRLSRKIIATLYRFYCKVFCRDI